MSRRAATLFRIPQSLEDDYRAWTTTDFEGWVDVDLYARLGGDIRADPDELLAAHGGRPARDRRNLTLSAPLAGRKTWIKRFRPGSRLDAAMYAPRAGKAVYAWNAAMALRGQGFCTPRPLIGLRGTGRWGGAEGIVVFEDIDGYASLAELLNSDPSRSVDRDELARALGECLRRFHDHGFRHRDLRRGNILAARLDGRWSFCFLDINRLRIQAPLDETQRLREVEKLNLDAGLLPAFFSTYMPERDSAVMTRRYRDRVDYADRLERRPLGRLLRKAWYYAWELRAFSRARRP